MGAKKSYLHPINGLTEEFPPDIIHTSQIWDARKGVGHVNNKNLLLGKMAMSGYSQVRLAEAIGMSKNTLSAKINGHRPFNTDEVIDICKVLEITNDAEKTNIFLSRAS